MQSFGDSFTHILIYVVINISSNKCDLNHLFIIFFYWVYFIKSKSDRMVAFLIQTRLCKKGYANTVCNAQYKTARIKIATTGSKTFDHVGALTATGSAT